MTRTEASRGTRAGFNTNFGEALVVHLNGPPQYRGSGWSGAWPGQDPSEVLGVPAAASGKIRRGRAKSAGVSRVRSLASPDPPHPASKAIRLGLYTCILHVRTYIYIYIYIHGFLVCRYARSLGLAARQNTPAIDAAFYRPNGTLYQLQPSFHPQST